MEPESERPPTAYEVAGMACWSTQAELVHEFWLRVVNFARAADAWAAYRFVMLEGATDGHA